MFSKSAGVEFNKSRDASRSKADSNSRKNCNKSTAETATAGTPRKAGMSATTETQTKKTRADGNSGDTNHSRNTRKCDVCICRDATARKTSTSACEKSSSAWSAARAVGDSILVHNRREASILGDSSNNRKVGNNRDVCNSGELLGCLQ